jgi:iron complex outermembrane receptor protein
MNTRPTLSIRVSPTVLLLLAALCPHAVHGDPAMATAASNSLLDMSLEELLDLEVTSVSKKRQRLSETTAAVFVITHEDIGQSGARNIPEALRLAPGVQVAQIDANKWAISARGFNGRFANKLLVLMDGRTLYTSSFSGVTWDIQDTVLEDVERIEVIRGPGGTLWGTNAVNGVINIITRSSRETQGGFVGSSYSNQSSVSAAARYGGLAHEDLSYRIYGKYFDEDGNQDLSGADTKDDWQVLRGGVRLDWTPSTPHLFSLSAEAYTGDIGSTMSIESLAPPYQSVVDDDQDVNGYFALALWSADWSPTKQSELRFYYDVNDRESLLYGEERETVDIEFKQRLIWRGSHDLVMSMGFRNDDFKFENSDLVITHTQTDNSTLNVFVQDEITLILDKLRLTLGSKFEKNDLSDTDWEIMPSARLLWSLDEDHHLWAAVTKAVRTPSHADLHSTITGVAPLIPPGDPANPFPLPIQNTVAGNHELRSEDLVAYELGYRAQYSSRLGLDAAIFFNDYDNLRSNELAGFFCAPSGTSVTLDPTCIFTSTNLANALIFGNELEARSYGLELAIDWSASDRVRLKASYALLKQDADHEGDISSESFIEDQSPEHQLSVLSEVALTSRTDLTAWVRFVDELTYFDIDSYWAADLRLAWRPTDSLELAMIGKNLLEDGHQEFISELNDIVPTEIERSFVATLQWSF